MPFYLWSETPNNNGSADPTINMAEGMAPSALNDGVRAAMARLREWGNDIAGVIVTGGTSTAYTVASNQSFDTLGHLDGQVIAFTPHTTSGATVTLSVDGLTAKPLRSAPSTEIVEGTLIEGTPYIAIYNNSDGAFYLRGFLSSPYNIPLLGGMDYWDTVTPNSAFIFPMGQAISRSVYSKAFARWGTKFGSGDGSTTFNVPDKTGRVSAMIEASATRLTSSYFGGDSTAIGATGGLESNTLSASQIPAHSHTASVTDPGHQHNTTQAPNIATSVTTSIVAGNGVIGAGTGIQSATTGITVSIANNTGGGNAHANVQPTIACNYIIRII